MIRGRVLARMLVASAAELGLAMVRPCWRVMIELAKRQPPRLPRGHRVEIIGGTGLIDIDEKCPECGEPPLGCDCLEED